MAWCCHDCADSSSTSTAEPLAVKFAELLARSDKPEMDRLFADDAVVVGIAGCKGKPCVGKADIRQRWFPRMMPPKPWELAVTHRHRDRVWASWALRVPTPWGQFSDTARGSLIISASATGDQIVRLVFGYDLTDPGAILLRFSMGEIPFALQGRDGIGNAPIRVLLASRGERTVVVVMLNDFELPSSLVATIDRGARPSFGDIAYPLAPFEDGQSHTILPITLDALASGSFSVVVRTTDGNVCASAKVPSPSERPSFTVAGH